MSTPICRVIVIQNKQGLHARPAELFVRLAMKYRSRIELVHGDRRVEARNMIDVLTIGAAQGTELLLEAEGDDAQEAVDALATLVESGFLREDAENEQQQIEEKTGN